jgi:hypothetical protein
LNYYVNRYLVSDHQRLCSNLGPTPTDSLNAPTISGSINACAGWRAFFAEVVPGVTIEVMSAFLIAGFFVGILALIREKEQALEDVSVLFNKDQHSSHMDALSKTTYWFHDGHLASWVRRKVLVNFKERACRTLATYHIKAAILDPSNSDACDDYINHVLGLEKEEQRIKNTEDLRVELCTSIYKFVTERRAQHFEIDLYLKNSVDLVRTDITAVRAFWTTTGRNKPAITLENRPSSLFYQLSCRNFNISVKRCRKIDIEKAMKAYLAAQGQPEASRVCAVLADIFPDNPELSDLSLGRSVLHRSKKK